MSDIPTNTNPQDNPANGGSTPPAPPPVPPVPPPPADKNDSAIPPNVAQNGHSAVPGTHQVGQVPEAWQDYSTGNSVLDTSIAGLLQTMGSNPEEFLSFTRNAIEYGDLNLLDTTAIKSKYPQYEEAIKSMTQAVIAQNQQTVSDIKNTAYGIAGSKENWDSAVRIFNANAPQYLRETVKTMIDNGHVQEGANMLMSTVQSFGSLPKNMPQYSGSAGTGKGITFDEMKAELAKLTAEAGGASLESGTYGRRYEDIMYRRSIGRAQGI